MSQLSHSIFSNFYVHVINPIKTSRKISTQVINCMFFCVNFNSVSKKSRSVVCLVKAIASLRRSVAPSNVTSQTSDHLCIGQPGQLLKFESAFVNKCHCRKEQNKTKHRRRYYTKSLFQC